MSDRGDRNSLRLTVRGAEKTDAGRGIARLPAAVSRKLGVVSGDTIVIEGAQRTVSKVWPTGPGISDPVIQIDGDTRANAGASIGDTVVVRKQTVSEATSITVSPETTIEGDPDEARRIVKRGLLDRPITTGDRFRVNRLGTDPFVVIATDPEGTVKVTERTTVKIPTRKPEDSPGAKPTRPDSGVTYEDIGGLDEQLERIREMIELPLSNPELFRRLSIEPPRGVLLHGPPGTGKTLIAKAVANEVEASFHHVSGPEIMSKYKGESEEKLREVFEDAREESPAIVFFDEIDSVAGKREDGGDVENRIVAQLLSLMDGLDSRGEVVVIGATNRVDVIDPALRRGGRFDREIEIGVPNKRGRHEILEVHTRGMPLADDVSVSKLADRTHGFVGADLHALVTEAAMIALRRVKPAEGTFDVDATTIEVGREDFDAALATVDPSAMREFVAEKPTVGFEAVGGLDEVKETLREAVEWPLSYTNLFEATATDPPSGVLLHGPPGTGKTLIARAIAKESGVNFIHVAGPELLDRYVGESEKAVREVFALARQAAPTILFFDEIDSVAGQRGGGRDGGSDVTERVVSQLLTELDGAIDNPNLIVLAATNRKHAIDPALLRPGRLEEHLEVPAPDAAGRREILAVHTRDKPLADDVDTEALAADLDGFTGADIAALARKASMRAIREAVAEHGIDDANERADEIRIDREDFEAVRGTIEPTME